MNFVVDHVAKNKFEGSNIEVRQSFGDVHLLIVQTAIKKHCCSIASRDIDILVLLIALAPF